MKPERSVCKAPHPARAGEIVPITTGPFDLAATMESGQVFHAFRSGACWEVLVGDGLFLLEQPDGKTLRVLRGDAVRAARYLALDHPLDEILATFPDDPYSRRALVSARGIRIVRQPEWECLATFITSPMKQVSHIRGMSLEIRARFGGTVPGASTKAYPGADVLAQLDEAALRACGLGFRAKGFLGAARMVAGGAIDLQELHQLPTEQLVGRLCGVPGVGRKVANCVALFAYGRLDAVPVDVWVARIAVGMRGRRGNSAALEKYSVRRFGPYAGYVQQYLFHHARTTGELPTRGGKRAAAMVAALLLGVLPAAVAAESAADPLIRILEKNPASLQALGLVLEKSAAPSEREALLRRLEHMAASDPLAHFPLGFARLESGDPAGAVRAFERVPPDRLTPDDAVALARGFFRAGSPDGAARLLESLASGNPGDPSLELEIAAAFDAIGRRDEAGKIFHRLASDAPPAVRLGALEAIAKGSARAGEPSADAWLDALALLEPGHWKFPSILAATIAAHPDDNSRARLAADWEMAAANGDRRAFLWLAALAGGNPAGEIEWLARAADAFPKNPGIRASLGLARRRAGDPAAADDLRAALAGGSHDPLVAAALAEILAGQGRESEAAEILARHLPAAELPGALRKLNLRGALEARLVAGFDPDDPSSAFALAEFFLESGRAAEAEAVFAKLALPEGPSRARTAVEIAGFFHSARRFPEMEKWARIARDWNPADPAPVLFLADAAVERGDFPAAREILLEAASKWPASDEADRRLLTAIQREFQNPGDRQAAIEALSTRFAAETPGGEAAWLRAARWKTWAGDHAGSAVLLAEALRTTPASRPLAEALADARERAGEPDLALAALENLVAGNPSDPALSLRLARLESARGNPDGAAAILRDACARHPNDDKLLAAMASAHEAAGNHFAALESWIAAHRIASAPARAEYFPRIMEEFRRLQLPARSLEFLAETVARTPEGPQRAAILKTAARHAAAIGKSASWEDKLSALLQAEPGSPSLISAATPMADPDSRATLEARLESATRDGKTAEAVRLAERLAMRADSTPPDFERWAGFSEATGADAGPVWEMAAGRFPREISTRLAAARYFGRAGRPDAALGHLRAAHALGPVPAPAMWDLISATSRAGEASAALDLIGDLLRRFPPSPSEADLPLPHLLRATGIESSRAAREAAIEEAGRLAANAPDPAAILAGLAIAGPAEAAWFHAGRGDARAAMAAITEAGTDRAPRSIAATLAGLRAWDALGGWIAADPARNQAVFDDVFPELLAAGLRPGEGTREFLSGLPPASRVNAAMALASAGWIRLAASVIPDRDLPAHLAGPAAFQLASWHLALRLPARDSLERVVREGVPGDSLDDPWFSAVRALWLTSSDRDRVARDARARVAAAGTGPSGKLLEILLASLSGGDVEEAVRSFLGKTPASVAALREGAKLESWDLDAAARRLFRAAKDSDRALEFLRGDLVPGELAESAMFQSLLQSSGPDAARFLVREWVAGGAKPAALAAAVGRAQASGNGPAAAVIARALVDLDPGNRQSWQILLDLSPAHARIPLDLNEKAARRIPDDILLRCVRTLVLDGQPEPRLTALLKADSPQAAALRALTTAHEGDPGPARLFFEETRPAALASVPDAELLALAAVVGSAAALPPRAALASPLTAPDAATRLLPRFLESRPTANDCLDLAGSVLTTQPERAAQLGFPFFEKLTAPAFPRQAARRETVLLDAARATGSLEAFRSGLRKRADAGKPGALAALLACEDPGLLPPRLAAAEALPRDQILAAARTLAAEKNFAAAALLYEHLDRDGINDPNIALEFATVLWKSGRRKEALEITSALAAAAPIDPSLHFGLAKFFIGVARPHAALRHIDAPNLPPRVKNRIEPLRKFLVEK